MTYYILFSLAGILCVYGCVYCYCLGVKHGRMVRDDKQPVAPNPVKAVERKIEQREDEKKDAEFFESVGSYTQDNMLQHLRNARAKGREA